MKKEEKPNKDESETQSESSKPFTGALEGLETKPTPGSRESLLSAIADYHTEVQRQKLTKVKTKARRLS